MSENFQYKPHNTKKAIFNLKGNSGYISFPIDFVKEADIGDGLEFDIDILEDGKIILRPDYISSVLDEIHAKYSEVLSHLA